MNWYFYIARCRDNSLYYGSTNNVEQRIDRHNKGFGAKWFKVHGPGKIVHSEKFYSYKKARSREVQVKGWSRIKKEKLINKEHPSACPKRTRSG